MKVRSRRADLSPSQADPQMSGASPVVRSLRPVSVASAEIRPGVRHESPRSHEEFLQADSSGKSKRSMSCAPMRRDATPMSPAPRQPPSFKRSKSVGSMPNEQLISPRRKTKGKKKGTGELKRRVKKTKEGRSRSSSRSLGEGSFSESSSKPVRRRNRTLSPTNREIRAEEGLRRSSIRSLDEEGSVETSSKQIRRRTRTLSPTSRKPKAEGRSRSSTRSLDEEESVEASSKPVRRRTKTLSPTSRKRADEGRSRSSSRSLDEEESMATSSKPVRRRTRTVSPTSREPRAEGGRSRSSSRSLDEEESVVTSSKPVRRRTRTVSPTSREPRAEEGRSRSSSRSLDEEGSVETSSKPVRRRTRTLSPTSRSTKKKVRSRSTSRGPDRIGRSKTSGKPEGRRTRTLSPTNRGMRRRSSSVAPSESSKESSKTKSRKAKAVDIQTLFPPRKAESQETNESVDPIRNYEQRTCIDQPQTPADIDIRTLFPKRGLVRQRSNTSSIATSEHSNGSIQADIIQEAGEIDDLPVTNHEPNFHEDVSKLMPRRAPRTGKRVSLRLQRLQKKSAIRIQSLARRYLAKRAMCERGTVSDAAEDVNLTLDSSRLSEMIREMEKKIWTMQQQTYLDMCDMKNEFEAEKVRFEVELREGFEILQRQSEEEILRDLDTVAFYNDEELVSLKRENTRLQSEIELLENMSNDLEEETVALEETNSRVTVMFESLKAFVATNLGKKQELERCSKEFGKMAVLNMRQEMRTVNVYTMVERAAKDVYRGHVYKQLYEIQECVPDSDLSKSIYEITRECEEELGNMVLNASDARMLLEPPSSDDEEDD